MSQFVRQIDELHGEMVRTALFIAKSIHSFSCQSWDVACILECQNLRCGSHLYLGRPSSIPVLENFSARA